MPMRRKAVPSASRSRRPRAAAKRTSGRGVGPGRRARGSGWRSGRSSASGRRRRRRGPFRAGAGRVSRPCARGAFEGGRVGEVGVEGGFGADGLGVHGVWTARASSPRARRARPGPSSPRRARARAVIERLEVGQAGEAPGVEPALERRADAGQEADGLGARMAAASAPRTAKPRGLSRPAASLASRRLGARPMETVMPTSASTRRAKRASTAAGGAACSASVPARSSTASSMRERLHEGGEVGHQRCGCGGRRRCIWRNRGG